MTDREKVIKDLEEVRRFIECENLPAHTLKAKLVIDDAIALLKAQEPRLVEPTDFEKADDYNWLPAWCEERTGAGYWEMILPDALDEKDVRYWTGRPTQEQMDETPWKIK